jgi:hypothetical protein
MRRHAEDMARLKRAFYGLSSAATIKLTHYRRSNSALFIGRGAPFYDFAANRCPALWRGITPTIAACCS